MLNSEQQVSQGITKEWKMKKINLFIILNTLITLCANACPTCIGRLQADSPPFFSKKQKQYESNTDKYKKKSKQKVEDGKSQKKDKK
jgi:hypothetical protein